MKLVSLEVEMCEILKKVPYRARTFVEIEHCMGMTEESIPNFVFTIEGSALRQEKSRFLHISSRSRGKKSSAHPSGELIQYAEWTALEVVVVHSLSEDMEEVAYRYITLADLDTSSPQQDRAVVGAMLRRAGLRLSRLRDLCLKNHVFTNAQLEAARLKRTMAV